MTNPPNKETIEKAREPVEFIQIYSPKDDGILRVEPLRHFPPLTKDRITQVVPREEYNSLERERDGLRALVEKANTLIYMVADKDMKIERWLEAKKEFNYEKS